MKIQQFLLPFFLCLALTAQAQNNQREEAANKALQDYKQLATLSAFPPSDRISASSLEKATLGQRIDHQIIGLEDLRAYKNTSDPKSIIRPINRATYPVLDANGMVITSIEVEQINGTWQTAQLGNRSYVQLFEDVRKANGLKNTEVSLVRVPGFNVYFMAREQNGRLDFSLLNETPMADISPRQFIDARTALDRLVPAAQKYNGLPW